MAEEGNTQTTPQDDAQQTDTQANSQQQTEPHGTDWKAEARKWESRAKANAEKAKKWDEEEEKQKTELQKEREAREKAEAELNRVTAQAEHLKLVNKVSSETGVPADLLHGETEEELEKSAQAISDFAASKSPSIPSDKGGSPNQKPITRDSIESIKNQAERIRMRAQHIDLYK